MTETSEVYYPVIYGANFHNNVCHVCKKTENLLRCSRCKTMAYCSKEHQMIDWKVHKKICLSFHQAFETYKNAKVANFEDYLALKKKRYAYIRSALKRELIGYENQMWMFPRFCEVCYSEKVELQCTSCRNVWFCSEDHMKSFKEQHGTHCNELKLQLEFLLALFNTDLKNINLSLRDIPITMKNLPNSLLDLLKLFSSDTDFAALNLQEKMFKLSCLHLAASILFGLEKSGILHDRLYPKNELVIHIVGANSYEMKQLWVTLVELIFHWIVNIINLEYYVIGPELGNNTIIDNICKELCSSCKKRKLKAKCSFHSKLYHNIANSLTKPDVIVCFNSGIHLQSSLSESLLEKPEKMWRDSMEYLVKYKDVPLILTAYTKKELIDDVAEVNRHSKQTLKVLVEPQRNPFGAAQPMRDFHSQLEPIYYVNGYISVLSP